jgi:hypothetical protein
MMKFSSRHIGPSRPRRRVILIGILVLIAGLLAYGATSYFVWRGVDDHRVRTAASLRENIETRFAEEIAGADPRGRIERALSEHRYDDTSSGCNVSFLYSWQMAVIPQLRDIQDQCDRSQVTINQTILAGEALIAFLDDQSKMSERLNDALTKADGAADYPALQTVWNDFRSGINEIVPVGDTATAFGPVYDTVLAISQDIDNAVNDAVKALEDEDKAALDEALAALDEAYARLPEVATLATQKQIELTDSFIEAYQGL